MRFAFFFGSIASFSAFTFTSGAEPAQNAFKNDLIIVASFPESNPFGYVFNGEQNSLFFSVENQSGENATLLGISGSIYHAESGKLVKNLTRSAISLPLLDKVKNQVPYTFYSEFKPGDARLTVWVDYVIEDQERLASAYDSVVTIVEPELSIFDIKLLSTYFILAAMAIGTGYLTFRSRFSQGKKARSKKSAAGYTISDIVHTTGVSGYEEWIPEHQLKKTKKGVKLSGGGDLSASELSGAEGQKRKAKK